MKCDISKLIAISAFHLSQSTRNTLSLASRRPDVTLNEAPIPYNVYDNNGNSWFLDLDSKIDAKISMPEDLERCIRTVQKICPDIRWIWFNYSPSKPEDLSKILPIYPAYGL